MGMVVVSVDCNALNGNGSGVQNIVDRADLIISNIAFLQTMNSDPTSVLNGTMDFTRVGLMGHSRGGDAVVTVPSVIGLAGGTIQAVLALAPTNFRCRMGRSTIQAKGYAFIPILPAGAGDGRDNNGAQFYDQALAVTIKSKLDVLVTCN